MKRRHLIATAALTPAALAQSSGSTGGFAKAWLRIFANHWRNERDYTLQVLDAMPPDGFDLKPNPAQRTFGEQLRHLGHANQAYFRSFQLLPVPEEIRVTDLASLDRLANASDKADVRRFLAACFDYGSAVIDKLTEEHLMRNDYQLRSPHTGMDVLLRAYTHTAHHRGQVIVYLRVKGIAPPAWKFEPS